MKFTDTGTLVNWQLDDIHIIHPLHDKADGGSRGGVYLCIPNFEELSPPFALKHGEYRITPCETDLPHQKNLTAPDETNWGSIEVITDWQEQTEANSKTLTVSTRIRAVSETALVRPGFHPYFSISPNSFIDIADTQIEVATLPHDSLRVHHANSPAAPIQLSTADYVVTMTCDISPLSASLALAFGIWSDKKAEYVCIEPIIGKQPGPDGLPTPLTLQQDEELVMVFTIRAERVRFAG
ncbi:hypothetical protein U737_02765 [Methylomonas sp. LW13]|uniref:hypothetical protein n=1 Tax=unclassified Methylomonas TaxID=2608980 RepID=UPI00051B221F|nr:MULTISPECIES: hypothetical protein [unclassified Methylomonas]PKD41190.1 hypothetical protein CWO84_05640 [Methylomonas sp. Kb3]QBC25927.1 hypothetical protein U737_02765 [Methylomonas sp. LW13]